jgi:hypothetical protein
MSTAPTPAPTQVPAPTVKDGVQTSEFWLHNVAQVFLTLNTTGVWVYVHPQWVSLIVQGVVLAGYTLSRGWAKSGGVSKVT